MSSSQKFTLYLNSEETGKKMAEISSHVLPPVGAEIQIEKTILQVTRVVLVLHKDKSGFWADRLSYHVLVRKTGDMAL